MCKINKGDWEAGYENIEKAIQKSEAENVKPTMKILHPLPRVNEISQDVDDTPYAYYFEQAGNGVYARMAIMAYLLGY